MTYFYVIFKYLTYIYVIIRLNHKGESYYNKPKILLI